MGPIGDAVGIFGTIAGGRQAEATAKYNAGLQRQQAYETLRASVAREELQRERSGQDLAMQRAALSANGIDPTSGSALIGVAQSMQDADLDALMLRYEGVSEARNQFLGAEATRLEGKARKRQANFSAAGQLAGAAGKYLGMGMGRPPGFSGTQMPAPVETRTPVPTLGRPFG
jgi:hypothetical protein